MMFANHGNYWNAQANQHINNMDAYLRRTEDAAKGVVINDESCP